MKQVLITNNGLQNYSGTECYVLEVARALLERGWRPLAFSTHLGEVAEALRSLSVPVVDDLKKLPRPPDLIHAHHHLDAAIAIQTFPGVPVIYFCHGWTPWQERPLLHPQIVHYVAVDELCYERIIYEAGIPESKVSVHLNFVDLKRFPRRPLLPAAPKRALMFGNGLGPKHPTSQAIANACQRQGIALDQVGRGFAKALTNPAEQLGNYDLVFAKARCALEAMATGCAVVTCDASGLAGMVTPENYDSFRALNFGYRLLRRNANPTVEDIEAELQRYQPDQAAEVTTRTRAEGGYSEAMDRLVLLYEQVLQVHPRIPVDTEASAQAIAAYLKDLAIQTKALHELPHELRKTREDLKLVREELRKSREDLKLTHGHHTKLKTQTQQRVDHEAQKLQKQRATHEGLHEAYKNLESYVQKLVQERDQLKLDKQTMKRSIRQQATELEKLQERLKRFRGLKRFLPKWML